jgi:hypothetical protein
MVIVTSPEDTSFDRAAKMTATKPITTTVNITTPRIMVIFSTFYAP